MADDQEVNIEADVGTVDNVVPLVDLLPKIAEGLAEETRRAEADPNVPPEVEARFRAATGHARQLADELQEARTAVPRFPFFARPGGRPGEPGGGPGGGPGRPDRPGGPGGRPPRPGGRPRRPPRP